MPGRSTHELRRRVFPFAFRSAADANGSKRTDATGFRNSSGKALSRHGPSTVEVLRKVTLQVKPSPNHAEKTLRN